MSKGIPKTIQVVTEVVPSGRIRGHEEDIGGQLDDEEESQSREIGINSREEISVPVEKLKQEMSGFLQAVDYIFSEAQQRQSNLELDELTLSVQINSEGGFKLLGIGGKAGATGGIQLKFKCRNLDQDD